MSGNNTGKHYICSICGSDEHTKVRHDKHQRGFYRGTIDNNRCSVCGELGHHANWHRQDEVKGQTEKLCKRCNIVLPISLFGKRIRAYRRNTDNGPGLEYIYYDPTCKRCYETTREVKIAESDINKVLVKRICSAQHRSAQFKAEFNIDISYVKELFDQQDGRCFFSGVEMTMSGSSSVSIDRVDSEGGYTKGNVVLCTTAINKMKNAYSMETFIDVCGKVWKHRGEV